jgi:hypothetical protein
MNQTRETVISTRLIRTVALLVIAAAVALLTWVVTRPDNNGTSTEKRAPAVAATAEALSTLPAQVGHDVFWAGEKAGYTYELTQTRDGRIYVRYLPAGVAIGDPRPAFLTVGTYPIRGGYENLKKQAARAGEATKTLPGGAVAVPGKQGQSVYFAYPRKDFQVEVYDPTPGRARSLVFSGKITATR